MATRRAKPIYIRVLRLLAMPFKKGQSGNPRGRAVESDHGVDLRQYARIRSRRAIELIVAIMRDESNNASLRLRAAEIILDRAWGRPTQHVEQTSTERLRQLSDAELREEIRYLAGQLGYIVKAN
jgi:hypothetical protein